MRLKLFHAPRMADAMDQVRAELGADALILNTRQVPGGVEITAALEPDEPPPPPDPTRLATLAWHGIPEDLRPALVRGSLTEALVDVVTFDNLPLGPNQRPIMFTGTPGAGKTLTTVRLATRMVMSGTLPMVITTDGKRAGAVEQLAAFTRVLGLPLLVATHPISLARTLTQRQNGAPVLIDTVGADAREPDQAAELKHLATAVDADIAFVLPAGLDAAEAADLAVANAACGARWLIATRLDLAHRLGSVVAAAAACRLPLTEAGVGAGAADGMVSFSPALLAERLSRTRASPGEAGGTDAGGRSEGFHIGYGQRKNGQATRATSNGNHPNGNQNAR
jgi:flagellar biosynthesis protein FlhF